MINLRLSKQSTFAASALAGLLWVSSGFVSAAETFNARDLDFFEKKIRPVLVEHCYSCHSTGEKVKGGLVLETREDVLKGGDSGPAIVSGQPDQSRLIEAVRYLNRDLQMPPKNPLSAEQVRDLEQWVKLGAPDPREKTAAPIKGKRVIDLAEGGRFWSFRSVTDAPVPAVKRTAWVQSPVDAFILAKLEEKNLKPAPPADRRTLIRRATFDLTGLPPKPTEVDAFLADRSPDAFTKVVDRLLASPQYGERWGRHWLDVARYADSNGLDENVAFGNAWRYRDYVINSFNGDKPFDQFVREQIAGDLMPAADVAARHEQIIATGFLGIGAKVLAEPDPKKMEMDIIDEQIEATGRAFLGLTLGCARCHDHKFDPVPTDDYYSLAAIFKSTQTMDTFKIVAKWHEPSLATDADLAAQKDYDQKLAASREAVAKLVKQANETLLTEARARAADYLVAAAKLPPTASTNEFDKVANEAHVHAPVLEKCFQFLTKATNSPVFKPWHEAVSRGAVEEVDRYYRPLFASVASALAESSSGTNALADAKLEAARRALLDPKGFLSAPAQADALYVGPIAEEVKRARSVVSDLETNAFELPSTMGVSESTNIVKTLPVHIRGSHLTLGKPVARGMLQVVNRVVKQPPFSEVQSGRLELADWLASPRQPLTARVMMNRVWRWHFGQGLVSTADNFGLLGEQPSHPELLDWLAHQFVARGWSLKAMHRVLMLSSAYQMSTTQDAHAASLDPENRLLWRANVQRLEAEQIRDALLAVSGKLDLTMGGKTIPMKNRAYVFNHTSKDGVSYTSPRRAVYLPIIRNNVYDLFEQFDFPDPAVPTGSRNATVVAPQALWMLNSGLITQAAEQTAAQLLTHPDWNDANRLKELYALAYGRLPTKHELARAEKFLTAFGESMKTKENRQQAWTAFCQSLFAANEFIYLN